MKIKVLSLFALCAISLACSGQANVPYGGNLDGAAQDGAGLTESGTPPPPGGTVADSDGDGVPDVIEEATGTNPQDPNDHLLLYGDFYFVEPYRQEAYPERHTMVFASSIKRADVFFAIDTSISMQGFIDQVKATLRNEIIPGVTQSIQDVQIGAAQFDICPTALPTAPNKCTGIKVEAPIGSDVAAVEAALGRMSADCQPVHEPYAQMAELFASGDVSRYGGNVAAPNCAGGGVGIGCARPDALPILLMIGDERFSESYTTNYDSTCGADGQLCAVCKAGPQVAEVSAALNTIGARLVVFGGTANSAEWKTIAQATRSVDASGAPLLFPNAATGTGAAIVEAISRLAQGVPLDLSARAVDVTGDSVDATRFIERIEPNLAGGFADPRDPNRVCVGGLATDDKDNDGQPDTFTNVQAGTPVCFDILPARNDTVAPTNVPEIYPAKIEIVADGVTVVDTRMVYFVVPPEGVKIDQPPVL